MPTTCPHCPCAEPRHRALGRRGRRRLGVRRQRQIAKRNLIWSIFAEHVGFSIWSIWSVMVLFMPQNVYGIDAAGKFYLVAVPTLVGAFMRIPVHRGAGHASAAATGRSSARCCC